MVLMPGCVCCGVADGCGGYSSSDRMVVTLANLPHENKNNNLILTYIPEQWSLGGEYLDAHNGTYVLYKQYSIDPTASAYSGLCVWTSYNGSGLGQAGFKAYASFGVTLQIRLSYDYNGAGSSLRWKREVSAWLEGGKITWEDSGTGLMPSTNKTYTNANVVLNESASWQYFYYWVRAPWTLTSATCSIAEYDAASHSAALKPCQCFDIPTAQDHTATTLGTDTQYRTTCLTYNGTSDPGTSTAFRELYAPGVNCSLAEDRTTFCAPVSSIYTLGPGGATGSSNTYKWGKFGVDELEIDLTDMTLAGTTYPTSGTYTLPWTGELATATSVPACWSGGSLTYYTGLPPSSPITWGSTGLHSSGWGAAFNFTYSSVDYLLWIAVSLRKTAYNSGSLVNPSTRRLYVSAAVLRLSGSTLYCMNGTAITWQSNGSQSEDSYTCGNMPTVTGGDGVSGTKYQFGCTGTAFSWSWEVRQA